MMREIVNDGNAIHFGLNFEPSLDALKGAQGFADHLLRYPVPGGHRCGRGGIPHVVFSSERKFKVRPLFSFSYNRPARTIGRQAQIRNSPRRAFASAISFHRTKRARNATFDALSAIKRDNSPAARN